MADVSLPAIYLLRRMRGQNCRVPPLIYLRLEVRDEAGNLSIDDRKAPIALDQVRPTAKIREG